MPSVAECELAPVKLQRTVSPWVAVVEAGVKPVSETVTLRVTFACGVAGLDGADGAPVPIALVAVTVNV